MGSAIQIEADNARNPLIAIGWVLLFLATIVAYYPGLHGPFVLDDFGAIAALGDFGGVRNWETFKAFVFGGHTGPTGRPLALLTFLIDATSWPTDSFAFKRTNLIIHLLNGALLGVLIRMILKLLQFEKQQARWVALVSVACWLLHPFLVSTTLYAVQRMAQLSTMFVFLGLITYLYGRSLIAVNTTKAYIVMSLAIGFFTLLAMLSKENGILLPLLIGVVEITVIASQQERLAVLNRYWRIAFIVAPSMIIVAYLGKTFFNDDFFDVVSPRDFSLYERLLTQPRILADYLQHWFIPKLYTTGVFQDHFIKSSGILSPLTTLLSVALHSAVIWISLVKRRKWPLFAFAALFFYSSHLLESTVLNLELYFEHRNYLSAGFLFVPVIVLMWQKLRWPYFQVAAIVIIMVLGGFTRYSATIWAEYSSMVEASAKKAPTSARAQAQYANNLFNAQRYNESLQVLDRAIQIIPGNDPLLLVNRLIILCNLNSLTVNELESVSRLLSSRRYDPRSIKIYIALTTVLVERKCPAVSIDTLQPLFVDMLKIAENRDVQSLGYSHIKYFIGMIDIYKGEPLRAVAAFEESLQSRPSASRAMNMAALLATNEYPAEALYLSNKALEQLDSDSKSIPIGDHVSESDIKSFQAIVRADMNELPDGDTFGQD